LEHRYAKYLCIPELEWNDGRLCRETSRELKRWLIASIVAKRRAQRRLAWNVGAYLAVIDHSNSFAATVAAIATSLGVEPRSTIDTKIE